MSHTWTKEQLEFFTLLRDTTSSIVLISVAGSGKTTTLVAGVELLTGSVLAVAFNVSIKKTLEDKIGHVAVCKTLNGLGHGALAKFFGGRIKIDRDKVRKIAKAMLDKPDTKHLWDQLFPIVRLVSRAKHHGLVPKGTPGNTKSLMEDTDESWEELLTHYDISIMPEAVYIARKVLRTSNTQAWQRICDFDDQIYIACCWNAPFERFSNVIIDEAQDLSEIQHAILKKVLKPEGRLIAVGDPNQAIYGFRGASSDSIGKLIKTFNLEKRHLTVSFRCAKRIVDEARHIVPRIKARSDAPMGIAIDLPSYSAETFKTGDTILCRNNAPLIRLAYRLIGCNKGVFVMGRDIGAGLKVVIKKVSSGNMKMTVPAFQTVLDTWYDIEFGRAKDKNQIGKMASLDDKYESLCAVIEGGRANNIQELIDEIDALFGKESAPIALGTIHKCKGLEWPRVFFLDPGLIPSIWTRKAFERDPETYEWMMTEEANIKYVGITRAMEELYYINSRDWEGGM